MDRYHLRRKDKEITDRRQITEILRDGRYIMLALCRKNEPYIVTLSHGLDEKSNALNFRCALKGLKLEFLKDNEEMCATVIVDRGYGTNECEQGYRSVVYRGRVIIVRGVEEKKHGLGALLNHLERNPTELRKKHLSNGGVPEKVCIVGLDTGEITGKEG